MGAAMNLQPINVNPDTFLRDHFVLPALPSIVNKVFAAVNSGSAGVKEVTRLISTDPAMASHILKVVNSAYYSLPRSIGEVSYAVAYLGLGEISRIVLTLSVVGSLSPAGRKEQERFWHHSHFTAIIAKCLMKWIKNIDAIEEVYAAALLHDIGKLVYQRFFPEHYGEMVRHSEASQGFLIESEDHFKLPSHQLFGSLLCEHWRLPKPIKKACEFHELFQIKTITDPSQADPFSLAITVANLLAVLSAEQLRDPLKGEIVEETKRVLRCSDGEFLVLMGEVYNLKIEADTFLSQLS